MKPQKTCCFFDSSDSTEGICIRRPDYPDRLLPLSLFWPAHGITDASFWRQVGFLIGMWLWRPRSRPHSVGNVEVPGPDPIKRRCATSDLTSVERLRRTIRRDRAVLQISKKGRG